MFTSILLKNLQKQINFLDVLMSKNENEKNLITSLFTKPTDTHQYLHATSCHRSVYKNSIPSGQTIRMKSSWLQRKLVDLESWLVDRGHKSEIIRPEIQKVNFIDRNSFLKKRPMCYPSIDFLPTTSYCFWCIKEDTSACTEVIFTKKVLPKPPCVAFRNP